MVSLICLRKTRFSNACRVCSIRSAELKSLECIAPSSGSVQSAGQLHVSLSRVYLSFRFPTPIRSYPLDCLHHPDSSVHCRTSGWVDLFVSRLGGGISTQKTQIVLNNSSVNLLKSCLTSVCISFSMSSPCSNCLSGGCWWHAAMEELQEKEHQHYSLWQPRLSENHRGPGAHLEEP